MTTDTKTYSLSEGLKLSDEIVFFTLLEIEAGEPAMVEVTYSGGLNESAYEKTELLGLTVARHSFGSRITTSQTRKDNLK